MGRYGEKATYVGFTAMCVCQRLFYLQAAAAMHDLTSLVLGFSVFIEGVRLTQLPMVVAYFAT